MNRENAIEYLEGKGKIRKKDKTVKEVMTTKAVKKKITVRKPAVKKVIEYTEPKYTKVEKEEIELVIKEGKIYGDPIAEVHW